MSGGKLLPEPSVMPSGAECAGAVNLAGTAWSQVKPAGNARRGIAHFRGSVDTQSWGVAVRPAVRGAFVAPE